MYRGAALAQLEKCLQESNACIKSSALLIDRVSTLLSRDLSDGGRLRTRHYDESIHARLTSASQVQSSLGRDAIL